MTFHIRPAEPADGPGIAFVRVTTWRAAYRGIIPQDFLDSLDVVAESDRWTRIVSNLDASRCAFVAEAPGGYATPGALRTAGYVFGGPDREGDPHYTGELYAIYVLPEYQGQGAGRQLFRAVTGWLAAQGHKAMLLYVLRDNAPSRAFYEALGGRVLGEKLVDTGGVMLPEVGYGYELGDAGAAGASPAVKR